MTSVLRHFTRLVINLMKVSLILILVFFSSFKLQIFISFYRLFGSGMEPEKKSGRGVGQRWNWRSKSNSKNEQAVLGTRNKSSSGGGRMAFRQSNIIDRAITKYGYNHPFRWGSIASGQPTLPNRTRSEHWGIGEFWWGRIASRTNDKSSLRSKKLYGKK